jgi:hypothetical protein
MALSVLEKKLLRKKIAAWVEQGQIGGDPPNEEIYQAILATEVQLQNGLEAFRLELISAAQQLIDALEDQQGQAQQDIDDLTP